MTKVLGNLHSPPLLYEVLGIDPTGISPVREVEKLGGESGCWVR